MSLNDSTLEGNTQNNKITKKAPDVKDPFDIFAETVAQGLFSKKPTLIRRIYESIKSTTKCASRIITRGR